MITFEANKPINNFHLKHKKKLNKTATLPDKGIQKTVFEKIYFYFFLLLPCIYSDKLVDPVLVPRQIYLTVFVFIIGLLVSYQISIKKIVGNFSFLKSPFFVSFALYLLFILISFSQAIVISESIYTFSKVLLEGSFLVFTTFLIIQKQLSIHSLVKSIIGFSVVILLIALFQCFQIYNLEDEFFKHVNKITSTSANKNLVSSILFIGVPFLIYSTRFSKTWKIVSSLILVVTVLLFWILQTKAVIIALFFFFIVAIILLITSKSKEISKIKLKLFGFSIILIVLVLTIVSFQNKEKLPNLFSSNTVKTRILLWDNSTEMIKDHLVWGVGAGNWQINFPKYGLDKFESLDVTTGMTNYQRPHNDFLWALSEIGIFGFVVYILLFIIILYSLFRLIYRTNESNKGLYILLFSAIIGYVIIAFSDFPFERIEHQILLYSLFSIVLGEYYLKFKANNLAVKNPLRVLFVSLFVLFIGEIVVASNRYSGELHSQKIFEAHRTSNWNLLIDEVDQATNDYYQITPMTIPLNWYKGVAIFSSGNIKEAKIIFEKALKTHPYNIHVLNNLGSCNEKLGNHFLAEFYYKKAIDISPHFEEVLLNLSAVYFNSKKFDKSFETINKCSVTCKDEKYAIFLPIILQSQVDKLIQKTKNVDLKNSLIQLKSDNTKLTSLYFDSKSILISFDEYLTRTFKL